MCIFTSQITAALLLLLNTKENTSLGKDNIRKDRLYWDKNGGNAVVKFDEQKILQSQQIPVVRLRGRGGFI